MAPNFRWQGPFWAAIFLSLLVINHSRASVYGPAPVSITLSGPSPIHEGETSYFTITKPVIVPVKVFLQTGGTATWGFDLAPSWGSTNIVIPVGTDRAEIAIRTFNDIYPEDTETAILRILPDPKNYTIVGPDAAVLEILDDDPLSGSNSPPAIRMTPFSGLISQQSNLVISASASDIDGESLLIRFFANDQIIGQSTQWNPRSTNLTFVWTNPIAGRQRIYATALDQRNGFASSATNEIIVAPAILDPVLIGSVTPTILFPGKATTQGSWQQAVVQWDIPFSITNVEAYVRFHGGTYLHEAFVFDGGSEITTNLWNAAGDFVNAFRSGSFLGEHELDLTPFINAYAGRRLALLLKMAPLDHVEYFTDLRLYLLTPETQAGWPRIHWRTNSSSSTSVDEGESLNLAVTVESRDVAIDRGWTFLDENSANGIPELLQFSGTNQIQVSIGNLTPGLHQVRVVTTSGGKQASSERLPFYVNAVKTRVFRFQSPSVESLVFRADFTRNLSSSWRIESSTDLVHWETLPYKLPYPGTNFVFTNTVGTLFFRAFE
jgi:hypothetical protein